VGRDFIRALVVRVSTKRNRRREIANFIRDPNRDATVLLNIVNVNICILLYRRHDFALNANNTFSVYAGRYKNNNDNYS